jgi:hypothetical protein
VATLQGKNLKAGCQHEPLGVKPSFPPHHLHPAAEGSIGNGRHAGFVAVTVRSGRDFIENLLHSKIHEPVCLYEKWELLNQINADECTQSLLKHNLITT